jgi:hypothetical protein
MSDPNDKLGNFNYEGLEEKTREEYREDVDKFNTTPNLTEDEEHT